ncbi:hypothetical protein CR970_04225 [Candidatus Saccharibacteria bacterium]|nr:MAG: hypothetical protein CR970_04225 [Candidatus Saccharibacteria bacterium]
MRGLDPKRQLKIVRLTLGVLLFAALGCVFSTRVGAPIRAYAAPTETLNFQARLTDAAGSTVSDGNYSVEFRLYDAEVGGTNEWIETQTVAVRSGYMSVYLGDVTPFGAGIDWTQAKWLTMNVNGDGEMNPRLRLTAVPYAFAAEQADTLTISAGSGSIGGDDLVWLSQGSAQQTTSATDAISINQLGSGGLLDLQSGGTSVFNVANDGLLSLGNGLKLGNSINNVAGTIRFNGNDFEGFNGSGWVSLTAGGPVAIQAYETAGGLNVNVTTPVAIPWAAESRKDPGMTHDNTTNNSRIYMDKAGWYKISYNVSSSNQTYTRHVIKCQVRLNGTTYLTPSTSYSYTRTTSAAPGSSNATAMHQTTSDNEYYEVMCSRAGPSGTDRTIANESWTIAEKVTAGNDGAGGGGGGGGGNSFNLGGNAFALDAVLGTLDNHTLTLMANNIDALRIGTDGSAVFTQALTAENGFAVSAGGATVVDGLAVSGGSSLSGGIDNNDGGITNTGALTGVDSLDGSGALSIRSGATGDLLLGSDSGTISLDADVLQRNGSGSTTIDLNDSSDTILQITNTNGGAAAGLQVEGAVTASAFSGDGNGLTNISANSIGSGTISDSLLSSNVAMLNVPQEFTQQQEFSAGLVLGNTAAASAGALRWNGADFEGYDGTQWVSLTSNGSAPLLEGVIAFGKYNGNSGTSLSADGATVTRNATGNYTVTFDTPAADANYIIQLTVDEPTSTMDDINISADNVSVNGFDVFVHEGDNGGSANNLRNRVWNYTVLDSNASAGGGTGGGGGLNFTQNGNDFGGVAILGTTSADELRLVTNGQNRLSLDGASGDVSIYNALTVGGGLQVDGGITSSAGLTISSGGSGALALDSASGVISIDGSDTALRRVGAGSYGIELNDAANTTLELLNGGGGTASLDIADGDLQLAGTVVLTNGGQATNLTGITSSGAIQFSSLNGGGLVKTDTSGNLSQAAAGTDYELPITVGNGLTRAGNSLQLGGNLSSATDIGLDGNQLTISGAGGSIFTAFADGGVDIRHDGTAAFAVHNSSGTVSYLSVDTAGNLVQVGSTAADTVAVLQVLDSYNDSTDPTGANGAQYYNTARGKFRCYEGGVWKDCIGTRQIRSFVDSTTDPVVDSNSTDYWDVSAENNNSHPNYTLSDSSQSIIGTVSAEVTSTSWSDRSVQMRIERGIGSAPSCGGGTVVGSRVSTFTSFNGESSTSTITFVDQPSTTGQVFYTLCSDNRTSSSSGVSVTHIRITLEEAANSN